MFLLRSQRYEGVGVVQSSLLLSNAVLVWLALSVDNHRLLPVFQRGLIASSKLAAEFVKVEGDDWVGRGLDSKLIARSINHIFCLAW